MSARVRKAGFAVLWEPVLSKALVAPVAPSWFLPGGGCSPSVASGTFCAQPWVSADPVLRYGPCFLEAGQQLPQAGPFCRRQQGGGACEPRVSPPSGSDGHQGSHGPLVSGVLLFLWTEVYFRAVLRSCLPLSCPDWCRSRASAASPSGKRCMVAVALRGNLTAVLATCWVSL